MPIEVRELIIKATIAQETNAGNTAASGGNTNPASNVEDIINACVEKLLEILKDKNAR